MTIMINDIVPSCKSQAYLTCACSGNKQNILLALDSGWLDSMDIEGILQEVSEKIGVSLYPDQLKQKALDRIQEKKRVLFYKKFQPIMNNINVKMASIGLNDSNILHHFTVLGFSDRARDAMERIWREKRDILIVYMGRETWERYARRNKANQKFEKMITLFNERPALKSVARLTLWVRNCEAWADAIFEQATFDPGQSTRCRMITGKITACVVNGIDELYRHITFPARYRQRLAESTLGRLKRPELKPSDGYAYDKDKCTRGKSRRKTF